MASFIAKAGGDNSSTPYQVQNRPKVGLVLSGGGAKGSAHIGVLKVIEEVGLPVDYVVGTSMGSIMGGIYALGYSASELEDIIKDVDWSLYMSNKVPRSAQSFQAKRNEMEYQLSVPFSTGLGLLAEMQKSGAGNYSIGASFVSSLPAGFINGQKVLNMLSGLSVGYQDSIDFATLPIPFACVAVDLIANKEIVLYSGSLPTSIRASMAIPGVFDPVRIGNMVLIDGGFKNNFPVDVCKAMGADIIIGVDVGSKGNLDADKTQSLPQLFSQMLNMITTGEHEDNEALCDIIIRPEISDFGSLSFDTASIDTLIERGYQAAAQKRVELENLKRYLNYYKYKTSEDVVKNITKAINMYKDNFAISGIECRGVSERDSKWLISKAHLHNKFIVTGVDIENAISVFYGTGIYSSVTHHFEGEHQPFKLVFNLETNQPHNFSFGIRYDSDEAANIHLNLGLNANRMNKLRLDVGGRLGINPQYCFTLSFAPYYLPRIGLEYDYKNIHLWYSLPSSRFKLMSDSFYRYQVEGFLAESYSKSFTSKVGYRYSYHSRYQTSNSILPEDRESYHVSGLHCRLDYDILDDGYYPKKGIKTSLSLSHTFTQNLFEDNKDGNFSTAYWDFHSAISLCDKLVLEPSLYIRAIFGDKLNQLFGSPFSNAMGGDIAGRYFDSQVPFAGLVSPMVCENYLGVAKADLRVQLADKFYLYGIYNYATFANSLSSFQQAVHIHGAAMKLSYHSIMGPISAQVQWSSIYDNIGLYFSAGFAF